jgi:non-homologous end joining protein Ku
MRVIRGKLKGKHVTLKAAEEPREAAVVDLMERLRRSLEQHKSKTKKRGRHAA